MQVIFILILILLICYTIFKIRKFDFFSIAALSAFIYYYPGIIGKLRNSSVLYDIPWQEYACISILLLTLFLVMLLSDKYVIRIGANLIYDPKCVRTQDIFFDSSTNLSVLVVELVGLILSARTFIQYGGFGDVFNKMQLLAQANRLTEYSKYIALFTFVYSFICNGKYSRIIKIFGLILISFTFLLGHRSFAVIGIIAIFIHYVGSSEPTKLWDTIKKHKLLFFAMVFAAFFFLFVKNVFAALITGQYDLVISRLTNPEYYRDSLLTSEANTIMLNLYSCITENMRYSFFQYLLGVVMLVPYFGGVLANYFGYVSFEKELNLQFNTSLSEGIGLGSTYLGEAYSMGGCLMVMFIMMLTYLALLLMIYKYNNTDSPLAYTFLGIVATYFTFYIHRNSLIFLLVAARAYLYIWLLIYIVRLFIRALLKGRN